MFTTAAAATILVGEKVAEKSLPEVAQFGKTAADANSEKRFLSGQLNEQMTTLSTALTAIEWMVWANISHPALKSYKYQLIN